MGDRIAEIRARVEAATPGPWRWWGNIDMRNIQLTTVDRGVLTVMAFRRWGMKGAAPTFFRRGPDMPWGWNGRQEEIQDVAVREVEYRGDIDHLANPNAELIAHAPGDIAYLLAENERLAQALAEAEGRLADARDRGLVR